MSSETTTSVELLAQISANQFPDWRYLGIDLHNLFPLNFDSNRSLLFSELFVASFSFTVMLLNDLTSSPSSSLLFSGIVLLYFPFAICLVASANNDIGSEILRLITNEAATADRIARSNTSVKVIVYIIFNELLLYASV